jgi:subtilisin family serine protease
VRVRRVRGRRSGGLSGLALLVVLLATAGATASASGARPAAAQVDPQVVRQIAKSGETTFWVVLRDKADLSQAPGIKDWGERGRYVYERLVHEADATQAGILNKLQKLGVDYKPFWVVNVIRVTAGDDVLKEIASDPAVERIYPDAVYHTERPQAGTAEARIASVEWNVDRINAPQVWATGDTGQGITIASVDTGVQFDHPALVRQYRGYLGNGQFNHNYNWYDPSNVCGNPSLAPCDNAQHGTHTMGTMVGDDGAGNQIGVAPGAKWITAKGCESTSCSTTALVSSGQWLLAPTDLYGNNPRPELRPNIISNSWGGASGDNFYQSVVDAWVAAGIMPVFANGNNGPGCNTASSPGDYLNTYAVGAFDSNNAIASFSSRGPSAFSNEIKPNISAPGVNVRSSVPTNSYATFSGTSMATPHVAATVALMWSAAPSLIGQISQTRSFLDSTAIDTSDTSCGGTAADNDVWGEGRLNAQAAVNASPTSSAGTLAGNITASENGNPLPGAEVDVVAGGTTRPTWTDASGHYQLKLGGGSYTVNVSLYGRLSQSAGVTVTNGSTATQGFALVAAQNHSLSGHVLDGNGNPVANAKVTIANTPLAPVTADGTGAYSFPSVADGSYDVLAYGGGRCIGSQTQHLSLSTNATLDFALPPKTDGVYTCSVSAHTFINGTTIVPLSGDDASAAVTLPSPFTFYGQTYTTAYVSTNGFVDLAGPPDPLTSFANGSLPSTDPPNLSIYPYWDDLYVDSSSSVQTALLGNQFAIEWSTVRYFVDSSRRITFEVILNLATGQIAFEYGLLGSDPLKQGNSATVGIENATGTVGIQYSFDEAALSDAEGIVFMPSSVPTITTTSLHDATTGTTYSPSETLQATGGTGSYTWSLAGGTNLPSSLTLSPAGVISGGVDSGDAAQSYSFTVQVTDSASKSSTKQLSIDVRTPLAIQTTSLPGGTVGTAYSQSVLATGGKTPYAFSLSAGSLPAGLSLDQGTGAITGAPTTAGTSNFTVKVTDAGNPMRQATQALSITVASGGGGSPPSAPQNLTAASATGKGVKLAWSAPASNGGSAIASYKVYRGTSSGVESLLTTLGNVLSYKDASTKRGTTYFYVVTAMNATAEGPPSNEASAKAK